MSSNTISGRPVGLPSLDYEPGAWRCPECLEIRREGEHYPDTRTKSGLAKRCRYCRDLKACKAEQARAQAASDISRNLKHWTKKAILVGQDPVEIVKTHKLCLWAEGVREKKLP
jgi:hypothetical protein